MAPPRSRRRQVRTPSRGLRSGWSSCKPSGRSVAKRDRPPPHSPPHGPPPSGKHAAPTARRSGPTEILPASSTADDRSRKSTADKGRKRRLLGSPSRGLPADRRRQDRSASIRVPKPESPSDRRGERRPIAGSPP